jgi:hypothetical protein
MDPISFSALALAVVTAITSSKGGKQAQDDLSTGIWGWMKPIFIEDDEEFVKDLESNPEDPDLTQELELRMKRKSKKDDDFAEKLREFFEKMGDEQKGTQTIIQSNVHGDNVGGNKNVYGK